MKCPQDSQATVNWMKLSHLREAPPCLLLPLVGMSACKGEEDPSSHPTAIYNLHLIKPALGILQSCMRAKPTCVHRDLIAHWSA